MKWFQEFLKKSIKNFYVSICLVIFIINSCSSGRIVTKNNNSPLAFLASNGREVETTSYRRQVGSKQPVTIIEFADYQCPYCVQAHKIIKNIHEKYNANGANKVQFIYLDYPISSIHPFAEPASIAAYCASKQNKFWQMHDALYGREPKEKLDLSFIFWAAKRSNLNFTKFKNCFSDSQGEAKNVIEKHKELGDLAGIRGTPTIYVNRQLFNKEIQELDPTIAFILNKNR